MTKIPVDFFGPIDEPRYFHGRRALLDACRKTPWRVRVLLGGPRIGKTSFLNQYEYEISKNTGSAHFFTIYMNIGLNIPSGKLDMFDRLLSKLAVTIRQSVDPLWPTHDTIHSVDCFEGRLEVAIEALRVHGFHGVSFALDECETLVGQDWWTKDASPTLRFEVESATFGKRLSFVFTGFRELRDHHQIVGSRLMDVATSDWLSPLGSSEVRALVHRRCGKRGVGDQELADVESLAGGHPWLTQRLVSSWLDSKSNSGRPSVREVGANLLVSLDHHFDVWWGRDGVKGGLKEPERRVYLALMSLGEASEVELATRTNQSEYNCRKCLHVLCGVGIVVATGDQSYRLGARLFADWVRDRGTSLEARIGPSTRPPDASSSNPHAKIESGQFDVFLCHNSKDKPEVKVIANQLKERGLLPWLDEWELQPGTPWQRTLEEQITKVKSAAVFIGSSGIGPWQDMEQAAFIRQFKNRKCPVIPVFLPGTPRPRPCQPSWKGRCTWIFAGSRPTPWTN